MSKYKLVSVKKLTTRTDAKRYNNGVLTVYYEDGIRKFEFDEDPTVRFHVSKPEFVDKHGTNPYVVPVEETEEIECKYRDIYEAIIDYQATFDKEAAEHNYELLDKFRKNKTNPENFFLCPFVHGADVELTDHYIRRFNDERVAPNGGEDNDVRLNKVFWDIECDNRVIRRFVEADEALTPINAISCFDSKTSTLILRFLDDTIEGQYVEKNPQIDKFKERMEEIRESYELDWNALQKKIFKDIEKPHINVEIHFYGKEIDLIKDHFNDLNYRFGADVVIAFNHGFDWGYTINRIENIGYDAGDIIAPKEFPKEYRRAYYIADRFAKDIKKRHDAFYIPAFYCIIDMQQNYYAIRNMSPEDYTLDWLAESVIGVRKVEHDDIEMADFPYEDYELFCKYSGQDTLVMYWIEEKVCDVDTIILFRGLTHTRESKVLTKTTMLRNFIEWFFINKCGLVLSNNRTRLFNKIYDKKRANGDNPVKYPELEKYRSDGMATDYTEVGEEEDEETLQTELEEIESQVTKIQEEKKVKFKGAFVADPNLLIANGIQILGKASTLIYDFVCDSDLSSLYPSIKIAWNLFITTMLGKILPKNNTNDIEYSATLANFIMTRNDIKIGEQYFGLPSHTEWTKMILSRA